jgi:4-amino-4-deoxy-L-arabinose transferase-like glycosyltransferase
VYITQLTRRISALSAIRRQVVVAPLVIIFALAVFLGRPNTPLLEPDESRYAEIPRQMLATGSWLIPTYHGQPYADKPPLLYWLVMLSEAAFGPNELAVHIVASLCGLTTILFTWLWARNVLGRRASWITAGLVLLMPRFVYHARILTPDTLLTTCVVAAWAGIHVASIGPTFRSRAWYGSAIAAGLGLLVKGPVAGVLVLGPLAVSWCRQRSWRRLMIGNLLGYLAVTLAVALPWYIALARHEPTLAGEFLWKHNVERYLQPFDHAQPMWYYVPALLLGLTPWLLFFPTAIREMCDDPDRRTLLPFIAASVCFIFFSLSGCKRPAYILPIYPALAIVLARSFAQQLDCRSVVWRWTTGIIALAVILGTYIAMPIYADHQSLREPARLCAADVVRGIPVACYPRPCDGAAFYLRLDRLPAYAEEHRAQLLQDLAGRPETILFIRGGTTLDEFIAQLPHDLTFQPLTHRAGTTIGKVFSLKHP